MLWRGRDLNLPCCLCSFPCQGKGTFVVDDDMIDMPTIKHSLNVVRQALATGRLALEDVPQPLHAPDERKDAIAPDMAKPHNANQPQQG